MSLSARNVFKGKVTAIKQGPIHADVEITTEGGDRIVAIVTKESVDSLALMIGKEAWAVFKASWVVLIAAKQEIRFSARNQLVGMVSEVSKGMVSSEVTLALPGGAAIHAMVTNEAVIELGLKTGVPATALIKASHVMIGVPA